MVISSRQAFRIAWTSEIETACPFGACYGGRAFECSGDQPGIRLGEDTLFQVQRITRFMTSADHLRLSSDIFFGFSEPLKPPFVSAPDRI